jgi:hypothetical protein
MVSESPDHHDGRDIRVSDFHVHASQLHFSLRCKLEAHR